MDLKHAYIIVVEYEEESRLEAKKFLVKTFALMLQKVQKRDLS